MFELKEKDFKTICTKTELWRTNGYPGIDPGLNEIVDLFNSFDELTTLASCKGHTTQGKGGFYLAFAAVNSDFKIIHDIYDNMLQVCHAVIETEKSSNRLKKIYAFFIANMTIKYVSKIAPIAPEVDSFWYKSVVFSLNRLGKQPEETREIFYCTLNLVVSMYITERYASVNVQEFIKRSFKNE